MQACTNLAAELNYNGGFLSNINSNILLLDYVISKIIGLRLVEYKIDHQELGSRNSDDRIEKIISTESCGFH